MSVIKSPMAGTVWKILVSVGDPVAKGQEVMILESMKMEIPVSSERAGNVVEIKCTEADFVEEDQVLVTLA